MLVVVPVGVLPTLNPRHRNRGHKTTLRTWDIYVFCGGERTCPGKIPAEHAVNASFHGGVLERQDRTARDCVPRIVVTVMPGAVTGDNTGIKMVLIDRASQPNLILKTSPTASAALVEPSYESLAFAFRLLGLAVTRIRTDSRWSEFIIHNIPTSLGDDFTTGKGVA